MACHNTPVYGNSELTSNRGLQESYHKATNASICLAQEFAHRLPFIYCLEFRRPVALFPATSAVLFSITHPYSSYSIAPASPL